jgi:hypothetical protein
VDDIDTADYSDVFIDESSEHKKIVNTATKWRIGCQFIYWPTGNKR